MSAANRQGIVREFHIVWRVVALLSVWASPFLYTNTDMPQAAESATVQKWNSPQVHYSSWASDDVSFLVNFVIKICHLLWHL